MLYAVAGFPLVLWIIFRFFVLDSATYEMDHGNGTAKGTFYPLLIMFSAFFYFVAVLALISAAYSKSSLFLVSAVEALLFNILVLVFYEGYLHVRYLGTRSNQEGRLYEEKGPSNYTRSKYALILSLAYSSILTLIAGAVLGLR